MVRLVPLIVLFVLASGCAGGANKRPPLVFESCAEGVRAVERGRVPDVFTRVRCGGENYTPYKAYARTPAGERCHIGYTCDYVDRVDPK